MNVDLIMQLSQRRSELLSELKDVDAQIRAAAGEQVRDAQEQQTPFSAYHACKELGLESRHETQMARMLSILASEGKIERLTEGTRSAQAVYRRKALQAVAS